MDIGYILISLISEEVGINVEGGIFRKNYIVHNGNKRGLEGGKRWIYFKISKRDFTFIREISVVFQD